MILITVSIYMLLMAAGIVIFSTSWFFRNYEKSLKNSEPVVVNMWSERFRGFLDYTTALALLTGAIGLLFQLRWGVHVSLIALVGMVYFCLKKFQWDNSVTENRIFGIFTKIGFVGTAISIVYIILIF